MIIFKGLWYQPSLGKFKAAIFNFVNAYEKYESYPMIHMQRIILMIISSLSIKRTQSPDTTKSTSKLTVQCITSISLLVYLSKYTLLRVDPSIF